MLITEDNVYQILEKGRRKVNQGAWNKKQMRVLGFDWPPPENWIDLIVNTEVSDDDIELFISLQSPAKKPLSKKQKKKKKKKLDPMKRDISYYL